MTAGAIALCLVALAIEAGATRMFGATPAVGATQPVDMAAPYEYLGWGNPQSPTAVMASTGIEDLTLAFILSKGKCNPTWDGSRPLLSGSDQAAITSIRAAGGDVDVSFGGWSGTKLGNSCKTVATLAAAYQRVITDYSLAAIDIDIEHTEISSAKVRSRVIAALAMVHRANPGLEISITFGTDENGPDAQGLSLIDDAAAIGFMPTAWTIMPFDFGAPVSDMGAVSIEAAQGLARDLAGAYHESDATAFTQVGISSMNGRTDDTGETVTVANFQDIVAFAQSNHLARLTFWSVNRDRSCGGADTNSDSCSGISQQPYAFTDLVAQYHG
jgi:chitinase